MNVTPNGSQGILYIYAILHYGCDFMAQSAVFASTQASLIEWKSEFLSNHLIQLL